MIQPILAKELAADPRLASEGWREIKRQWASTLAGSAKSASDGGGKKTREDQSVKSLRISWLKMMGKTRGPMVGETS